MIPIVLLAVFAVEVERAGISAADGRIMFQQITHESDWRHEVCSSAGACGLTQFTGPTWGDIAPATRPSCEGMTRDHAPCAIRAMIVYDKRLLRANRGAETKRHRWALALSAYNGGQGWVDKESRKCAGSAGCSPGRWAGHVQKVCLRAEWACRENKAYPGGIMARVEAAFGGGSTRASASVGPGGWSASVSIAGGS